MIIVNGAVSYDSNEYHDTASLLGVGAWNAPLACAGRIHPDELPYQRFEAVQGDNRLCVQGHLVPTFGPWADLMWEMEGSIIGGFLEIGRDFSVAPGQPSARGKVEAKTEAWIPVDSLKPVKWRNSSKVPRMLQEALRSSFNEAKGQNIRYFLKQLSATNSAGPNGRVFESVGDLVVAGVTNELKMQLTFLPVGEKSLRISGAGKIKPADFDIKPLYLTSEPPLKSTDEVQVSFQWVVRKQGSFCP